MRTIIKGQAYDTDKAEELTTIDNNLPHSDFGYWTETLYVKKTGEYFLHGEGGAQSKYAKCAGGSWGWGAAFTPLTYEKAQEWVEKYVPEEYEKIFGAVGEGDERLSVTLSAEAKAKLNAYRSKTGKTFREIIEGFAATLPE